MIFLKMNHFSYCFLMFSLNQFLVLLLVHIWQMNVTTNLGPAFPRPVASTFGGETAWAAGQVIWEQAFDSRQFFLQDGKMMRNVTKTHIYIYIFHIYYMKLKNILIEFIVVQIFSCLSKSSKICKLIVALKHHIYLL